MQFDVSFLPDIALVFMLVFARIGTMLMLMPALGEGSISTRVRLSLAVLLTLIFYPLAQPLYGIDTATGLPQVAQMLALEFAVGFFIGLGARMITYALSVAGMIIANQTGLAFAMATDPTMDGQQGAVIGSFLSLLAVTMVFATNLHYLVIAAMNDSFTMFPPGAPLPVGDMAEMATTMVADLFTVAMRLSAPFLVVGLVFYFGLGLLNKLMPQMQIFFIAMPVTIGVGALMLFALLTTMMMWYLSHFEMALGRFIAG
ncbi:MAG: flagellar biosynthetic protein FliR [Stappia sp.]|uniref:flagellar biosynthetic protein FliR n=1 Tax=Stappia sp. TaxID=1870903 RepID=UPI000C50F02A|nr:flagellar biosynthetic protein FliR [Stappia sp.]MAA98275.1 flagellar biosynthetic protein FliR [Stappia sp.]MBM19754.1 flagellar biosynthetic protein FliR [Stappia sp.]|tara:strand:+ start:68 stop:841 length:774 start_codon:yes stop_codon:yes gene_type:complete